MARSFVFVKYFVDRCLSFFSFVYCIVCPSFIYAFKFPFPYLQIFLSMLELYMCARKCECISHVKQLNKIKLRSTSLWFENKCSLNK